MNPIVVVEACGIPIDVQKGKGRRYVFPIYHHDLWICEFGDLKLLT
jgi:hypothetical protein